MFDLEQAIADWRRQMLAAGIQSPVPLVELEEHLREDVERQVQTGTDVHQAFNLASQQLGQAKRLKREFMKSYSVMDIVKRAIWTLAGIPAPLATSTGTPPPETSIEPGWTTYFRNCVFVLPSMLLWVVSCIFLIPKLKAMSCLEGFELFGLVNGMLLLTQHGPFISGCILLALVLLEWRWSQWPRYRRAVVGVGTFILNTVILVSLTLLIVTAILTAPAPIHPAG